MKLLAVDPGKISGVATGRFDEELSFVGTLELEPMRTCEVAEAFIANEADMVVCESFVPRPGVRTWQPDALEIIGALRYLCWVWNVEFALQSPADAKRFSTNEKLKAIGWWQPTKDGHANDAYRHLLLAAVRGGLIDPEVLLS